MRRFFSTAFSVGCLALIFCSTASADLIESKGHITFLRIHDVGTGYGPPSDYIDVEVVVQLDSQPGKAFGFQLRNDNFRSARQGMLDLLRDAFSNNYPVLIDYQHHSTQKQRRDHPRRCSEAVTLTHSHCRQRRACCHFAHVPCVIM